MAFKIILISALVALAQSSPVSQGWQSKPSGWEPQPKPSYGWEPQPKPSYGWEKPSNGWEQKEAPANYEFQYHVDDHHTKDIKAHHEQAQNGKVHGQYWLIDSDGHKRIVDYTADDIHGFQATVRREPTDIIVPIPAKNHGWEKPASNGWEQPKPSYGWEQPKPINNGWEQKPINNGWEQKPMNNGWEVKPKIPSGWAQPQQQYKKW